MIEKYSENVGSGYSRQLGNVRQIPIDVIRHENAGPSSALEVAAVVEQDDEGAPKRITFIVTGMTDVLLRIAKQGDRTLALGLVNILNEVTFDIKTFLRFFKTMADYETVSTRRMKEMMKDDGF